MRAARRSGCQLDCIDQRYVRTDAAVASPSLRHVITFLIAEFSRVNGERAFDMGLILLILIIVLLFGGGGYYGYRSGYYGGRHYGGGLGLILLIVILLLLFGGGGYWHY
jgi:hypothetical protein